MGRGWFPAIDDVNDVDICGNVSGRLSAPTEWPFSAPICKGRHSGRLVPSCRRQGSCAATFFSKVWKRGDDMTHQIISILEL
ncbi:unnamed protein product [Gongylonema pulchrum]|uniref:Uncharacterized protein n=1 Tax=Gongylonema pulchrum TaxID=637853 RepID=A0A183CV61_9BILA|nr:unnamed protein product [Gongylonema pulchrum]